MRTCPHCAEPIQDAAKVCPHCRRDVEPAAARSAGGPERRLWTGRPALRSQLGKVSLAMLLILGGAAAAILLAEGKVGGLVAIGLGVVVLAAAWLRVITSRYEITTRRAIAREGLFQQTLNEVQLDDVRNVVLVRGIKDRLLGLGTVALSTSGQGGLELSMRSIKRPQAVVDLVNQQNQ